MAMTRASSISQYRSRNPGSAILGTGTIAAGGLGSGGEAAGAAGITIGAGTITGGGVTALATLLLALDVFFLATFAAGFATSAGCSATATGAGAGSGIATGAGDFSATAATGAGAATGTSAGLVAQADKAKAERNRAADTTTLGVLDMAFSPDTVSGMRSGGIFPQLALPGKQLNAARAVARKNSASYHGNGMQQQKNKGPNYGPLSHCLLLPDDSGNTGG